jgi:hypothetical protein
VLAFIEAEISGERDMLSDIEVVKRGLMSADDVIDIVDGKVEAMIKKKEKMDHLLQEKMIRENLRKQLHQEKLEESKKSVKSIFRSQL